MSTTDLDVLCGNCGRRFGDHAFEGQRCPGRASRFEATAARQSRPPTLNDLLKAAAAAGVQPIWRRQVQTTAADKKPVINFVLANRDVIEKAAGWEGGDDGG